LLLWQVRRLEERKTKNEKKRMTQHDDHHEHKEDTDDGTSKQGKQQPVRGSVVWGGVAAAVVAGVMVAVWLPRLSLSLSLDGPVAGGGGDGGEEDGEVVLRVPRSFADVGVLCCGVGAAAAVRPCEVSAVFFGAYVVLQAFSVPGSVLLSVLAGALFGPVSALCLVVISASVGACCAFGLSHAVVVRGLMRWWPLWRGGGGGGGDGSLWQQRVGVLREGVLRHRGRVFWYLLFLRLTPFLPNWFLNLACPVLGVRLGVFAAATALGVVPASLLCVRAGRALFVAAGCSGGGGGGAGGVASAAGVGGVVSFGLFSDPAAVLCLVVLSVLALLPGLSPVVRWFRAVIASSSSSTISPSSTTSTNKASD
jgi:uncharacterized membrane protein YdjX (TVP38/TMEM64 family)